MTRKSSSSIQACRFSITCSRGRESVKSSDVHCRYCVHSSLVLSISALVLCVRFKVSTIRQHTFFPIHSHFAKGGFLFSRVTRRCVSCQKATILHMPKCDHTTLRYHSPLGSFTFDSNALLITPALTLFLRQPPFCDL